MSSAAATSSSTVKIRHTVYSRPYQPGDEAQVVALYNKVTGRSRTLEQHAWEWLHAPQGAGSMWVIEWEEAGTKKIIGHHGLIPVPMTVFGKKVLAGKTENTVVDPDYRDKILYLRFEQSFLKQAKERFALLFTTEGYGSPDRIRRRLGYVPVSIYEPFVKPKGNDGLDRAAAGLLRSIGLPDANGALLRLCRSFVSRYFRETTADDRVAVSDDLPFDAIAPELDEFCERNNGFLGVSVNRDSAYLKWRIVDNPHLPYGFFVARQGTALVGYVVVEYRTTRDVRIADIVADNKDANLFDSILAAVEDLLVARGFNMFQYAGLGGRSWLNASFRRCGYRPQAGLQRKLGLRRTEERCLLVRTLQDVEDAAAITNPDHWYFSDLFREGISHPPSRQL